MTPVVVTRSNLRPPIHQKWSSSSALPAQRDEVARQLPEHPNVGQVMDLGRGAGLPISGGPPPPWTPVSARVGRSGTLFFPRPPRPGGPNRSNANLERPRAWEPRNQGLVRH
jgi:hypothetical protein